MQTLTDSRSLAATSLVLAALAVPDLDAQVIQPPFNQSYSVRSLGPVPGVPVPYGGVTFKYDDPDVLLIGGSSGRSVGALYAVRVTRAANGAITGFQGAASQLASTPHIDGGLQYGPNNVLFHTRNTNELGQLLPGSAAPDKVIHLGSLRGGPAYSPGAMSFVPPGFAGAGHLKFYSYLGGGWYDSTVIPDGNGTFDVAGVQQTSFLGGNAQGILYPPPGSPLLPDYSRVIVTLFGYGSVAVYDLDANGDPIEATRQMFMTDVANAMGATLDPPSGSFLFSTSGNGLDRLLVVEGFGSCGSFVGYGTGIPGSRGVAPSIRGTGCATFNRPIDFQVGGGPANGIGAMNVGFQQLSIRIFGGYVLTDPSIPLPHVLDGQGSWNTTISTPNDPNLVGRSVFFQAAYVDPGAPFGLAASDGLEMRVR